MPAHWAEFNVTDPSQFPASGRPHGRGTATRHSGAPQVLAMDSCSVGPSGAAVAPDRADRFNSARPYGAPGQWDGAVEEYRSASRLDSRLPRLALAQYASHAV
jgi:hypothetical protein